MKLARLGGLLMAAGIFVIGLGSLGAAEAAGVTTSKGTPAQGASPGQAEALRHVGVVPEKRPERIFSMRVTWQPVPRAVKYQVVVLKSAEDTPANIALTLNDVFTTGIDIPLSTFGEGAKDYYWKVCPLDYYGNAIGHFSTPQPFSASGEENPEAPLPTTEYGKMAYTPEYLVYSWIPTAGAHHHQVEVRSETEGGRLLRTLSADDYDVYDSQPFNVRGSYSWRVRAVTDSGEPLTEWSPKSVFSVTSPTPFAALGDSITHGGGVMSLPPGYTIYDWETYSSVPVKNLGLSGNTTQEMLDRFEQDVLPFSPRVLVIMGGVNDFRGTTFGATTVDHLIALRDKCDMYGIIPVFVTPTPIQPSLMSRAGVEQPPSDWQVHQQYINRWIMSQRYAIDITGPLTDAYGNLRADYTTDGLHPDYEGKKYIGETIGNYLASHFAWLLYK